MWRYYTNDARYFSRNFCGTFSLKLRHNRLPAYWLNVISTTTKRAGNIWRCVTTWTFITNYDAALINCCQASDKKRREKIWREKHIALLLKARALIAKSKTIILEVHRGPIIVASQIFDKSQPLGGVLGQRKALTVLIYRLPKCKLCKLS